MIKTITLPFPDKKLMPNNCNGKHWGYNCKEKKKAKDWAYYATRSVISKDMQYIPKLEFTFYCPDSRRRDPDNLMAAMKSTIDGVALALFSDDSIFTYKEPIKGIDRKRPRVEIRIEVIE